jgi:heme exporter protein D
MQTQWASVQEFVAMGGYGFYVWASFGVTALCLIWEVVAVRHRHALALKQKTAEGGLLQL